MAVSSELSCLLNAMEEPALLIRPEDMTVAAANTAFLKVFGGFRFEGKKCWEALHRADDCVRCALGCPLREAMRTREEAVVEQTVFASARATRFRVALRPVWASDGRILYWLERIRVEQGLGMQSMTRGQVGISAAHEDLMRQLTKAAAAHYPVLITGEKGIGKELYARTVHENSVFASRPFVAVPASVLTPANDDMMLFGCEKTRGRAARAGLMARAAGGTLFIDGIEALSLSTQKKIAQVMEAGAFLPIGSSVAVVAAFRFMASASQPPARLFAQGVLDESILKQFEHHVIAVTPLRERKDDIEPLARHFVRGLPPANTYTITKEAIEELKERSWGGNARELREVIENAAMHAQDFTITASDIKQTGSGQREEDGDVMSLYHDGWVTLHEMQERYLSYAVRKFAGSRAELAQTLGVSERTLYRLYAQAKKNA